MQVVGIDAAAENRPDNAQLVDEDDATYAAVVLMFDMPEVDQLDQLDEPMASPDPDPVLQPPEEVAPPDTEMELNERELPMEQLLELPLEQPLVPLPTQQLAETADWFMGVYLTKIKNQLVNINMQEQELNKVDAGLGSCIDLNIKAITVSIYTSYSVGKVRSCHFVVNNTIHTRSFASKSSQCNISEVWSKNRQEYRTCQSVISDVTLSRQFRYYYGIIVVLNMYRQRRDISY